MSDLRAKEARAAFYATMQKKYGTEINEFVVETLDAYRKIRDEKGTAEAYAMVLTAVSRAIRPMIEKAGSFLDLVAQEEYHTFLITWGMALTLLTEWETEE